MKKIIIISYLLCICISSNCSAFVYDLSIRSFAESKTFVIKRNELNGEYLRGKDRSNYSPTAINDYMRLNNKEERRLVFDHEKYIWILAGKKLMANGLEGEKVKCIVASIPLTVGLEGETSLDVASAVAIKVDYAFCEPIGDQDWHLAGKDRGLALLPQELWFKDVKNDVPEYMQKMKTYDTSDEEERLILLMEYLKKWSDVRGLAVLEQLIELPNINIQDIALIINSKGNEFQLHSLRVILASNLTKEEKYQFTDPKSENRLKNIEQLVPRLAKWPIDPKDAFMIQVNLLLKQFAEN